MKASGRVRAAYYRCGPKAWVRRFVKGYGFSRTAKRQIEMGL